MNARPELKDRLPSVENPPPPPGPLSTIDTRFAATYLHMDRYTSWHDTVDATLDSLLTAEKDWEI
ncbi:hypothetical protein AN958_05958 [Leucoagaricus sp. SymC.cos]|nr:hypothetical protein AN958_05958 [Leucoagaricus sp. SymC.cos]